MELIPACFSAFGWKSERTSCYSRQDASLQQRYRNFYQSCGIARGGEKFAMAFCCAILGNPITSIDEEYKKMLEVMVKKMAFNKKLYLDFAPRGHF